MRALYLKALEIQGFKSFPDKTVLTFGEDITAIVGPNGSGKSNISDAIRWVMGEQSTKALRGGKMEDVIFGGTAKRKQLGFAEVSLVLDNAEHIFPMEESEVMVTRRYYRSGESEYYINRRSVRLKDVNELFMDTGLGREGYSIIGQGKIDEILSVKSADRREVFEEAAGISRFRHRKEEAERKLERTEENLVRINDKIDELELQVEPLRIQSEKARKFLILRDELRGLEISVWLEQLEKIRASSIKVLSDFENAVRQKAEARAQVEALYAAAEGYAAKMREKDMEAEGIRFEMMQRDADANGLENAVAVLKTNIQNNLENGDRLQRELEAQEGRAGSITGQIEDRRKRLEGIVREAESLRAQLRERQRSAEDASRNAGALAAEMEVLRQKEAVETASAAEARALLSALAAAAQELMDRDEAVRQELAAGEGRLAETEKEGKTASEELNQAREDRDSLKNIINGYTLRLESRRKKAREAEEKHVKLQMEESALASRIHMLTEMEKLYEGYSKAVKLVMGEADRGQLRGVHGPVAGLIHVPEQYAVAIEIALGSAMQNVVVEREEDGKNAIQYLKRRDAGRATFLPLTSIRPSEFRDRGVANEAGFVGMGDQLIEFDGKYGRVFSSLLGRTVIAEDMDKAIAIARKYGSRFKIVTLDGQVLNPGGSMTGGSVSRSAGILSRANELERLNVQIVGVRESLHQARRALEETTREVAAAQYEMETAQAQQRAHEDAILTLEERCSHYGVLLADLRRQRDDQKTELEQLQKRAAQTEQDTGNARRRIEALEGAAAALRAEAEGKAQGQSRFQEKAGEIGAEIAEFNMRLASLDAERMASEKALDELEGLRRDMAGDREERYQLIEDLRKRNGELSAQILEKETALQTIREENRERNEAIRRINQEKLDLEAERNRADKDSRDKNAELLSMEREVSVLEQKKVTAALEEKQILDKLWETYELSHEAARAQRVELESVPKAQRRIGELKRSITGLGNINLDAIDEFQRVNERYTYLRDQRDDVQKSKRELENIIADITTEMKTIFSEQFAVINQAFGETFAELFGGGKATLELEDPEDILNCGIEIKVQPPGKALKIITLLSGGEKAFVAIALYFAILKVRPTPFCVMDEIEAALDDVNVARYAHYLRSMSGRTQFIVITHRRGTMEEADVLYGVTMQEQGVTRILTINLNDVEKELNIK
ncbi:chromosome segregation protein SMC [Pseudoflavonifractor sp. BIOML-A6]|nr:chromosome segregation protein SMC [Pseudoflavonifractor sp. BIOML-A16]MTR13093.1 chromosome segregation protein SMC [Pseudoflavonifractor sp. BIOML-A17]MTR19976.1 chromosome segregation protein SMC [Pseudoflavonifractor sp. BIOML-A19]MTR34066.1 chromosome segregation protein SMC [Pseudoflavonifractor sp. BIOML-A14]MTR35083.1 chromosome segregation protein SMC [Pseudoflavonifractor sp. BIOML-A9]MTR47204.1 chromosome segregation protein SMC [Pseudoflavonifractor sp. BIOML-A13]MTR73189.1 chr